MQNISNTMQGISAQEPPINAEAPTTPPSTAAAAAAAAASTSDNNEPSPSYASLSPAAKTKFRSIESKRVGKTSETRMWFCRERCDMPFSTKAQRTIHERRCRLGLVERRLASKQRFQERVEGRSEEDVMNEWEGLLEESRRRVGGAEEEDGGVKVEEEEELEGMVEEGEAGEEGLVAAKNQVLGGLEEVGGKETALRNAMGPRPVFSSEFMAKYGAMPTEEEHAGGAMLAEFIAKYGAADVEPAEPEVQIKVEVEDEDDGGIPLGEIWWVPQ